LLASSIIYRVSIPQQILNELDPTKPLPQSLLPPKYNDCHSAVSFFFSIDEPTAAQRCRSETEKSILKDLFSPVLSQKNYPSGNLNFNSLGIFKILKFHILMEKILRISLGLNYFFLNTLGLSWVKCIY